MEPQIIDYYSETPTMVKVIDKMNHELEMIQNKYDELKKIYEPEKSIEYYIINSHQSHGDMAKLMYLLYGKEFACTSIKKNEWYFYDKNINKWRLSDDGIELRIKLSTHIQNIYERKIKETDKNIIKCNGDDDQYIYKYNMYIKIYHNLKKPFYKQKVMKECKDLFYDKDFKSLNKYIIEDVDDYYEYY
tara:strand:+ start:678 stop:1244 length:567 start_codon:yes stop_codon:yes gene_type:complete